MKLALPPAGLGFLTISLTLLSEKSDISTNVGGIVAMGEVVADLYHSEGSSALELPFTARPGGSPANVAVGAARLGARTSFIGAVGEDLFGEFILNALSSEGVGTEGVRRLPAPSRTSIAFVEIDAHGERSFTFYRSSPAADELLSPQDISEDMLSGASFLTFGGIPLIGERTRARSAPTSASS